MNILFLSRLFYPHIGGVEKHVAEISKILIKKGNKVTVVTEQCLKSLKTTGNIEGTKVLRIPNLNDGKFKKFKIWKWLWINRKLIKDADIVHCHDVFFWYLPFRFLFPFKKVFTTFHGYESYPLGKKDIFIRKLSEKLSNGNICVGDFIKKWYDTKPTYVTYGAMNIMKSEKRKTKNKNSAIFIGRLDEQTGIKTYVRAVKLIRKKIPDFKFEIVGDGKFKKEINKEFKTLGFKKNPEAYFLKHNFAFVSRYLSILEAMVAKKLVIATFDDPIKEDYLKMSPFAKHIIIAGSAREVCDTTLHFLKNSREMQEKVEIGYKWVKNQTWDKLTQVYLKLWSH